MSLVDVCFITHLNSENRVKLFVQTFESFIQNTNFNLVKSITLVDDASPIPIISEIPNMTYIKNEKQSGVGFSKNLAVVQGTAKYVYLSDTDVFFTENWLDKLLKAYQDNKDYFKLLGGGIHPYLLPRQGEDGIGITSHDAISGWSWLLERKIWNKYGPLDSHAIGSGQSEDWAFSRKLVEDGYKVGCLKNQVISHCGVTNTENKLVLGSELFKRLDGVLYL